VADELFDLIFTGDLREGASLEQVQRDLAAAFQTDVEKIARVFRPGGGVVRRNVDRQTAEKYRKFVEAAGAVCTIEALSSPVDPASRESASNPAQEPSGPRIAHLRSVASRLQHSPLRINRLGAAESGINLNRADYAEVAFGNILAVSALKQQDSASGPPPRSKASTRTSYSNAPNSER